MTLSVNADKEFEMHSSSSVHIDFSNPDQVAAALKALGHPVRLQMIRELNSTAKPCCGDICDCFTFSQSTISQHLSVLVDAGLVACDQDGNKSRFSLNQRAISNLCAALAKFAEIPRNE